MSRHMRNAAVAFGQQVLGALTGAVGMFFIARRVPDADFHIGIVGSGLAFVGLFLFLQRAFDGAHVKRVSEGRDLAACNSTYAVLNALATGAMVLGVVLAILVWTGLLGQGFQTGLEVPVMLMFVVYQVLNSLGEMVRRTYEGQGNILFGQLILSAEHVVKGAAMVYVAFFGLTPLVDGGRDAIGITGAYVVGAVALALVASVLVWGQPFGRPSKELVKSYAVFALPTTITASLFLFNSNIPILVVKLFWSARDAGYYFAPQRYIQFLPAIATAVSTALFPVFSALHSKGRTDPELVRRTIRIVSLILLPTLAVTIALPEAIIHVLLSDKFLPGAPVLAILAVGAYLDAVRRTLSTKLAGVDRPTEVTKAGLASLSANIVLSVVLVAPALFGIPLLGLKAVGAAIAVTLSQLVGMGTILRAVKKHAGVTLPPLWRHALVLVGTIAVLYAITLWLPQTAFRVYHLVGAALLAIVVTVLLGMLVGEVTREDRQLAWQLLHPGEWRRFMREEGRRRP